ncbi:MAG: class I mannose-6-phosphate isomerase [Actinobacteria bacterium]|nr:class I mannose-6-phosphate isomerase [Actinomycetota bacterium]
MRALGPLVFEPILVEKPWGGRRLADLGRDLPDDTLIGESWDVTDLGGTGDAAGDPLCSSVVLGPESSGRTLRDLVAAHGVELLGEMHATSWGGFPLLVKHLDAGQHLSVQVHPSAAVIDELPGAHIKSEAWVVVAAEPDAQIYLGVRPGVTPEQVEGAFGTPALVELLRTVPARVGDVHDVPAGLIHSLGAGVVVAEPQTPSDTTYRLYDWTKEYGRAPRDLHRDEAMTCLRAEWSVNLDPPAVRGDDGVVVRSEAFTVRRVPARGLDVEQVSVEARPSPRTIIVLTGEVGMPDGRLIAPGGVVVLPAAWSGTLESRHTTSWVEIDLHR